MWYPIIDMKRTGRRIKEVCNQKGISTKDVQEYMNFSASQSVYNWFRGKSLPSLDNFYALSKLLDLPMENLIIAENAVIYELSATGRNKNRQFFLAYRKNLPGILSTSL